MDCTGIARSVYTIPTLLSYYIIYIMFRGIVQCERFLSQRKLVVWLIRTRLFLSRFAVIGNVKAAAFEDDRWSGEYSLHV